VALVGEADVGREPGELVFALGEPLEGGTDEEPRAVT
jgi:hypothetical protein